MRKNCYITVCPPLPLGLLSHEYADGHGIARTFYPLQGIINFDINPVKAAWMPLVADHEVFLNSALMCSEIHKRLIETDARDVYSNAYFQRAVQLVNSRIGKGEIDDALIGAVSCLVLIEHCLEHFDSSAIHHAGMGEVIRVYGGVQTIRYPLQMKVVRADIIPCVDRLKTPKLPHPKHTVPSLHATMFPNADPDGRLAMDLNAAGLSHHISGIMLDISAFSQSLSYAIRHQLTVPYRAYDEDTMGFQYDLLLAPKEHLHKIDLICRSGALLFLKALTREDPVPNDFISNPMIAALKKIEVDASNVKIVFWAMFMSGLFATNVVGRQFVKEELSRLRQIAQLHTWYDAEDLLKSIGWVPEVHSSMGFALWNQFALSTWAPAFRQEPTPPLTPGLPTPP
jgi:hypothetical protein